MIFHYSFRFTLFCQKLSERKLSSPGHIKTFFMRKEEGNSLIFQENVENKSETISRLQLNHLICVEVEVE